MKRLLYWAPRALAIAFAGFLALFALDVFGEEDGWLETAVGLAMHLIPTALVLMVLAVSWRREWVGAVAYFGLALAYLGLFRGRFPWTTLLVIAGPLILTAGLFLLNWRWRSALRS
jgi:hypothetical protein